MSRVISESLQCREKACEVCYELKNESTWERYPKWSKEFIGASAYISQPDQVVVFFFLMSALLAYL